MDLASFVWPLGQTLSLFALAAGAWLSIPNSEAIRGYYRERRSTHAPHLELHDPLNHRLRYEPEW